MPVRALEFYCGIGGLHLAFIRSGTGGSIVRAFDWNQSAYEVYAANYPQTSITKVDISTLSAAVLATFNADLWLLSPACQPYTVLNPNAKGASDPRARSFLHLVQTVLPDLATTNLHPMRLLIENVAGFESSDTRRILLTTLRSLGYTTLELLITPLQYGIPNSRLRYYLLAKRKPLMFCHISDQHTSDFIWRHIPGSRPWTDLRTETSNITYSNGAQAVALTSQAFPHRIRDYLDRPRSEIPHPSAIPDKVLEKWGRLFDIVLPSATRSCCFTRAYTQLVERSGSVLQTNETLETTETFDEFYQARLQDEKEAIRILHPLGLRYFTPAELLRLFGFTPPNTETKFSWPTNISTKTQYRLIGNSVNVRVVQELIAYLFQE